LLWMSVPLVLSALLTSMLHVPRRTNSDPTLRVAAYWREIWSSRGTLAPIMLGLAMMEIGIGAILIWAAPALMRSFHAGAHQVGTVLASGVLLSGSIGPLAGGMLADKCQSSAGPRLTLLVLSCLSLLCAPLAIFDRTADLSVASILLFIAMTVMIGIAVMGTSLFTIIVPERSRGFFLSVLVAANVLFALGVAPLVVTAFSAGLGGPAHLASALAMVLMSASLIAGGAFAVGHLRQPAAVGS
jgi:MFS family permease